MSIFLCVLNEEFWLVLSCLLQLWNFIHYTDTYYITYKSRNFPTFNSLHFVSVDLISGRRLLCVDYHVLVTNSEETFTVFFWVSDCDVADLNKPILWYSTYQFQELHNIKDDKVYRDSRQRKFTSFFDPFDCNVERLCLIWGEASMFPLSNDAMAYVYRWSWYNT